MELTWLLCLAQVAPAQNPVSWSIKANAGRALKPGDKLNVQVIAQIEGGWHIYSLTQGAGGPIPLRITVPDGQPFKLAGSAKGPAPRVKMDPNFGINTETYDGSASFNVPLMVAADAQPGAQNVQVNVRYQACSDTLCLPPKTAKLSAPVELVAAMAAVTATPSPSRQASPTPSPKATPTPTPAANVNSNVNANVNANHNAAQIAATPAEVTSTGATTTAQTQNANSSTTTTTTTTQTALTSSGFNQNGSLWSFIWLAMTVGALSLLTPCVFPMVPITVSYFTNHAAGNRRVAVRDAVIYALGIILTFTALGVALALLFGAAGINKFAANPWVNLIITAIFISFALSLFGAYNLQVPSSVLTKLDAVSRNKETGRVAGLLLMGLTFSLTSFTCTAPFVGTLLVMAAQGDWVYPVIGMLSFSTVFALPFFVLALAPQLVSQLPKSGGWLNSVKVVMGLLEVAAAMKFLSNVDLVWHWGVFTREVVLASWVAVALLITLYLLGKFQLTHDMAVERIGAARLMVALASLSLGFYLLTGLFGARLGELESFLPPATENSSLVASASGGATKIGELSWITNDYEGALAQARAEGKPVFIDFTGYTCTNCRWMEANMFTKGAVRQELEKYVRLRLYTDGEGEVYEKQQQMQQEKFGTVALPYYAVVDGAGKVLTGFPGLTRNETEFVSFLQSGHTKFAPETAGMNRDATPR